MKKFTLTLFVTLLIGIQAVLAQDIRVTGIVSDANGPLAGATVIVEGMATRGTTTTGNGTYAINVPADATLQFSFVGMVPVLVPVNNRTMIDVVLEADTQMIDDVIVVAFGASTRPTYTGSASVVGTDAIAQSQQSNIAQTLAGRAAGVQLSNESGQLDASPRIRIRGFSSITAEKEPLWVVDGVPYEGNLNHLNPNDIESMTVLKDAASNALYGARGANGVIMVTTKKGRTREATITFDAKIGVNMRALKEYEYIKDPGTFYETHYGALKSYYMDNGLSEGDAHARANTNVVGNAGVGGLAYQIFNVPDGQEFIGTNGKVNPAATLGNRITHNGQDYLLKPDNWYDEAYRTSMRQEYNVSVGSRSDRSSFYASFGYLDNQGITENSDLTRYTVRLNADHQAKSWLKVGGNASYTNYESNSLTNEGSSSSTGNVFAFTAGIAPIYPVYVRDGQGNIMKNESGITLFDYGDGMNAGLERPHLGGSNALSDSRLNTNDYKEGNALNGTGFVEAVFLKDFRFRFDAGVSVDEYRTTTVRNPYFGQFAGENGIVGKYHRRQFTTNLTQSLYYSKSINGVHNINVTLAHDYYRRRFYYLYGTKSNMFSQQNKELAGAIIDKQGASSYTTDKMNEGYLGRVEYNYDSKYFFSGSFRRDASTRFHPDNRWGNFWSVSGAWLLTNEEFMKSTSNWLDMLKFRASYGEQGNDAIPAYRYVDTYQIWNSNDEIGLLFYAKGNKNITWETVGSFNVGFDFDLTKGLLSGSIEYFHRKTSDMLFSFPVAPSLGYSSYYANVGDMVNQGLELDLKINPVKTKDVDWDIYLNFMHLKNEITYLPQERKTLTVDGKQGYVSGSTFYGEGLSIYGLYYKKYAGVNEKGQSMWYKETQDEHGNVTASETTTSYSEGSYHILGNPIPDLQGGFGTTVKFFGFDFSANFNYQIGGDAYDSGYAASMYGPSGSSVGMNWHKDILKAWSPTNTNSNIPRVQYNDPSVTGTSDRFITDASYLNLQNLMLGYTLPEKLVRKIGVENVRVYVTCENVHFWSKRRGFDPRYSFTGATSQATYSPIRTISGGLTLRF